MLWNINHNPQNKIDSQWKFKAQSKSMSVVKVRAVIVKEWHLIYWDWYLWKDPIEAENFEPSESWVYLTWVSGLSTLSRNVCTSLPPEILLFFSLLNEEINPSLSAKLEYHFLKEMPGKTLLIMSPRAHQCFIKPITILKASRGEIKRIHRKVHYTTKDLHEFGNAFSEKVSEYV